MSRVQLNIVNHAVYIAKSFKIRNKFLITDSLQHGCLRLLLQHPGVAFTREKLMERVWGTDYLGETRTVDMHVRTLRQKLGVCGEMIETVRGVGYRLEAQT